MKNSLANPAPTQPATNMRPSKIEHGEEVVFSPALKVLPEGSETAHTQTGRRAGRVNCRKLVATAALAGAALAIPVLGQAPDSGFKVFGGYRGVDIGQHVYAHDTHPDDSFLPGADVPGSAGKTEVGGLLHFGTVGLGYDFRLGRSWSAGFEVAVLLGGERDEDQNDNDDRRPAEGAFVYSESRVGVFAAAGLSYHLKRWSLGAQAAVAGVFVDHGWDRFGSDESEEEDFVLAPSGGPKLAYALNEHASVELTVQFGRSVTAGLQLVYRF